MTSYRTYSAVDAISGESTLSGHNKHNARFTDILSWFPAAGSQYQALLGNSGGTGFTTSHVLRSDVALEHTDGNGSQYQALISDGDGTTSWVHQIRSNVALDHDDGNGTVGQLLQSDGDGTLSWATTGNLTDSDKGDITVTSSGTVWTIDNDAITTGKVADKAITQDKAGYTFVSKTTAYTAVAENYILCDTATTAAFTVTFPVSASAGDKIYINDSVGNFDTANLTIDPNGLNIESQAADLVLNIKNFTGLYYYVDATIGWKRI